MTLAQLVNGRRKMGGSVGVQCSVQTGENCELKTAVTHSARLTRAGPEQSERLSFLACNNRPVRQLSAVERAALFYPAL